MPDYAWHPDATHADMTLPSPEYRILAAFRIWNVVHFFHATPDDEWHTRLGEFITMLEHAETRQEYERALAEIMALANDGQASASTTAAAAAPPFRLMTVEEKPVVVESRTDSVKAGDELLRIDGRDVSEQMAELARSTSASTDAAKQAAILRALANGAASSQSTFSFRRPDGTTYDAPLTRTVETFDDPKPWRILEGNVAYVDMRYLDAAEVPILFNEVAGTRAMILDLRNGARDVVAELAQRMNVNGSTSMSSMVVPELIGGAFDSATIDQSLGGSSLPTYAGRTIALVDEGTTGHGEEVALTLATIGRTDIVGTPTAGASGPVTSFVVPGNILVRFTGADVRYADGREVHGTGVQPTYRATRTIHGLAQGHDEVLEKAFEIVN
jgi:C-terminal processing protease CtpA/Prc